MKRLLCCIVAILMLCGCSKPIEKTDKEDTTPQPSISEAVHIVTLPEDLLENAKKLLKYAKALEGITSEEYENMAKDGYVSEIISLSDDVSSIAFDNTNIKDDDANIYQTMKNIERQCNSIADICYDMNRGISLKNYEVGLKFKKGSYLKDQEALSEYIANLEGFLK